MPGTLNFIFSEVPAKRFKTLVHRYFAPYLYTCARVRMFAPYVK